MQQRLVCATSFVAHVRKATVSSPQIPRSLGSQQCVSKGMTATVRAGRATNSHKVNLSHGRIDDTNIVDLLRKCAKEKDLFKGARLHADVSRKGLLGNNSYVSNALVTMYAKCGALEQARELLFCLPKRDVFSWNALISGYAQQGHAHDALDCFGKMQRDGLAPNAVTFSCILKACASIGALDQGKQLHKMIAKQGLLKRDLVLGNALVDMYAKCGSLDKAQLVLEQLPVRDVVSWSAVIAGYVQQSQGKEALSCFEHMKHEGIFPNVVTFACVLRACASIKDEAKGEEIHDLICKQGLLEKNTSLGNVLVDMYVKCGALVKAQQVLEEHPTLTAFPWSTLIGAYTEQGCGQEALNCFQQMQRRCIVPSSVGYVWILKACGIVGAVDKGSQIHDDIARERLLEKDIVIGNALVDMYAKCGALAKAHAVLQELPTRDVVSWSALIAGYTQHGQGQSALECFEQMQHEGVSPNTVTYTCILNACADMGALDKVERIHDEIGKKGLLSKDIMLGNALIHMYAKCGEFDKAQHVLEGLPDQNVVSYNALIAGYANQGQGEEALDCFECMKQRGLSPNAVTYHCIVKACVSLRATEKGKEIHDEIVSQGLLQKDIMLGNAVVDMFAKCGALAKAHEVLEKLPVRDVISWSALISGYIQQGKGDDALECFEKMQRDGVAPNAVTFTCVLKACANIGAVDKGERVHDEIKRQGLLEKDIMLGTALVDMYSKCGALGKAQELLEEMPIGDVVSWSALIAGYTQQGQGREALNCFELMQHKGLCPDAVTFSCVLNACSHSGLVDEAEIHFSEMTTKYGILPDVDHFTCMVDIFGRAGHFDKAVNTIKKMPSSDCPVVWSALLGACRKWGEVKVGKWAFENAVQLDKHDASAYVCMANTYAAAGLQKEAENIEAMRVQNKAWKKPGCSWWIDKSGKVHKFTVGDTKHPQSKLIKAKLEELSDVLYRKGYSPDLHWVSQNINDDAKKVVLRSHSEKLAIACALINTRPGDTVRIVQNMRVCGDCHASTGLIAKIEKRKIVIKDANRCHVFEDGKCSCGDYW